MAPAPKTSTVTPSEISVFQIGLEEFCCLLWGPDETHKVTTWTIVRVWTLKQAVYIITTAL